MSRNSVPPRASRTYQTTAPPVANEEDDDDVYLPAAMPRSAIRYTTTQGQQVIQQGKRRIIIHNEPPPRRFHWLWFVGLGMVVMVGLFIGFVVISNWWTNQQLNGTYGFPRTYQTDAVVYPGDSPEHPSHYIFLNLQGTVEIIELPHGDSARARIYKGPTLYADNAALIPVTGEFKEVNGKMEMLVHLQAQTIVYVNDGSQFKPQS